MHCADIDTNAGDDNHINGDDTDFQRLVMIIENHGNNWCHDNDDGISIYIGLHWLTLDGDAGDDN